VKFKSRRQAINAKLRLDSQENIEQLKIVFALLKDSTHQHLKPQSILALENTAVILSKKLEKMGIPKSRISEISAYYATS